MRSQVAGVSTHSSKTIMMSAPSAICTSIECSGEKKCLLPSRCERNSTPSSVTLRSSESENTWKPPESVSIGRCQLMKRCTPPSAPDQLVPGPQVQVIGVGEDDLRAGADRCRCVSSVSCGTVFTVAAVPTGMNTGVCTVAVRQMQRGAAAAGRARRRNLERQAHRLSMHGRPWPANLRQAVPSRSSFALTRSVGKSTSWKLPICTFLL